MHFAARRREDAAHLSAFVEQRRFDLVGVRRTDLGDGAVIPEHRVWVVWIAGARGSPDDLAALVDAHGLGVVATERAEIGDGAAAPQDRALAIGRVAREADDIAAVIDVRGFGA